MGIERDPGSSGEGAIRRRRPGSLRLRLSGWTVAVFIVTLAIFTAAGIVEERQQVLRNETDQARAFVEHLAQMPEFRGKSEETAARLASIRGLLRSRGADLQIVRRPPGPHVPSPGPMELNDGVLAIRRISLADGIFELRYWKDPARFRPIAARSVTIHVVHAILALVLLVAGTEWILRRRLMVPLARISDQVNRMRQGGGWLTILPQTDAELDALAGAIEKLGPGLEQQVHQWIEAERRAAVALALKDVRARLRDSLRDVRALAGDLNARDLVVPAGKRKVRSLLADIDRVEQTLGAEERLSFAPRMPGGTPSDRSGSGQGASP